MAKPVWLDCTKCGKRKHHTKFSINNSSNFAYRGHRDCWCKRCRRDATAEYDATHPGRRQRNREANRERDRATNKRSHQSSYTRLKLKLIEGYGGQCECCGEDDLHFLTIDHRDGYIPDHHRYPDGKRRTGYQLMKIIIDDGFPEYMRVLCYNCNLAIAHNGYCPHQEPNREYRMSA